MLRSIARSLATRRLLKLAPLARVLVVAELALLAKRHLDLLSPAERRRFVDLVKKGRGLTGTEATELRTLTARVEPGAFARSAAGSLSPIPLPDRLTGRKRR